MRKKWILGWLVGFQSFLVLGLHAAETNQIEFNEGWMFERFGQLPQGQMRMEPDAAVVSFDDTDWQSVTLPHTYGIVGPGEINLQNYKAGKGGEYYWLDRVGEVTPVHVFTSGDEAELFLNCKSLGRKKKGKYEYRRWDDVIYQPGELKVVAFKNGKVWAEATRQMTDKPASVQLKADRSVLKADGRDLAFVTVSLEDAKGTLCAGNQQPFGLLNQGPGKIVAVDNGDSANRESFQSLNYPLFKGLAQATQGTAKIRIHNQNRWEIA